MQYLVTLLSTLVSIPGSASAEPIPLPNVLIETEWTGSTPVIEGGRSSVISSQDAAVKLQFDGNTNTWIFEGGTTTCQVVSAATMPCSSKQQLNTCGFWINQCAETNDQIEALRWCNTFHFDSDGGEMFVYSQSVDASATPSCPTIPVDRLDFKGSLRRATKAAHNAGASEAFIFQRTASS